jgi:quinol monooxygenase YgiN
VSKFAVVMKMVAHEGKGPELEAAFNGVFRQVEGEPSTEFYVLNRSASHPDVLWCYEVFSSRSAFEAHCDTDTVRELIPRLDKLLASREVMQGEPVRGRGITV